MHKLVIFVIAGLIVGTVSAPAVAQTDENVTEDPAHAELRALRDGLIASVDRSDIDGILSYCDPEIVLTAQHGEVARGLDGMRTYLERMLTGPDRVIESFSIKPKVDSLSILHGDDTAIAYGSSQDHFVLTSGMEMTLDCRWTVTVVKNGDRWQVAAVHSSANVLDNAVLNAATSWIWKGAAIAGGVGLVLGFAIAGILFRKRTQQPAAASAKP